VPSNLIDIESPAEVRVFCDFNVKIKDISPTTENEDCVLDAMVEVPFLTSSTLNVVAAEGSD